MSVEDVGSIVVVELLESEGDRNENEECFCFQVLMSLIPPCSLSVSRLSLAAGG